MGRGFRNIYPDQTVQPRLLRVDSDNATYQDLDRSQMGSRVKTRDPCAWEDQTQFVAADTKNTQRYLVIVRE